MFITSGGTYGNKCKNITTSLSETYNITLDNAIQTVITGVTDPQTAIRQSLRALADSGIKTVDYASGYSRRLDSSVRQNILWGIKQCNQEIADMVGEEIGADGYEISYHSNPRPSHADMGGQLYAKGEGRTIKGVYYPSIDTVQPLLDEYGCLHFKFSVILGLSESTYSKKELARLKANDNKPVVFEGKKITKYEASQKQSTLETAMRHCDDRLTIAKAADNEILILKETERMRQLQNKYNELSKASGLPTKWERTVSGLKTSKKPLTKGGSGGIINTKILNSKVINPMSPKKYAKMRSALESKGIKFVAATEGDDLRYLLAIGAEAVYARGYIRHIGEIPSASAFFEEIIHMAQEKKYGRLLETDFIERDAREIAANRKLLKFYKEYGFTETDYEDIKINLEKWEESFKKRTGVSYEESDHKRNI